MKFAVENEGLSLKQLVCYVIEKIHLDQYQHSNLGLIVPSWPADSYGGLVVPMKGFP